MTPEQDMAVISQRLTTASKSLAQGFLAMAHAAREAGAAAKSFKVACYPDIPSDDHPIAKQMRAFAEAEGKELLLVKYPRHIPDKVFGQTWIIFDEIADLDWTRFPKWYRRTVVRRRGKTMVFRA